MITIDDGFGDRLVKVTFGEDVLEFVVAREDFGAVLKSYKFATEAGLLDVERPPREEGADPPKQDPLERIAVFHYQVMTLIKSWKGPCYPDGKPAPCNDATKRRLFGKYPGLLFDIVHELRAQEEAEAKNSGTSQSG